MWFRALLLMVVWSLGLLPSFAQTVADSTQVVRLELKDGSVLFGQVVEAGQAGLKLRFAHGELLWIPQNQITRQEIIQQSATGKLFELDPNQTRLLFAPTARAVPKGDAYIANYYLFLNFVGYGVSDRFTMAGGFSMFPGAGIGNQAYYIAPKYTLIQEEKQQLGLGLWAGGAGLQESSKVVGGIPYLNYTRGSAQKSLTLALGLPVYKKTVYSYDPDRLTPTETRKWKAAEGVITVLGGERQLGRRTKWVTEAWLIWGKDVPRFPENTFLASALRYYNQSFALDFGFLFLGPSDDFVGIPYLDVVYHIRKKKP